MSQTILPAERDGIKTLPGATEPAREMEHQVNLRHAHPETPMLTSPYMSLGTVVSTGKVLQAAGYM